MQFVIFDLEWNGSYSYKRKKIFNEIIEIGAVKLSEELKIIEKFSMLVKPQVGKKIKRNIQNLTHISNDDLQRANNSFGHVYKMFGKFTKDCILMSWGEVDIITLIDNCDYFGLNREKINTNKYIDLQKYIQKYLTLEEKSEQIGLTTAALMLSLSVKNIQLHRALSDSLLASLCFQKTYEENLINSSIVTFDEEFYKRIMFKNTFITDINNPIIKKEYLQVKCNKCGRYIKRNTEWLNKNKGFKANFCCRKCNLNYDVRIKFKLKYEGLTITKRVKEIVSENKEEQ